MALTLALSMVDPYMSAGKATTFQVTVTNTGASSVTLTQLFAGETSESDVTVGQPNFMTPNVPVGVGNPTLLPNTPVAYTFRCAFPGPATPGPSPNQSSVAGGSLSGGGMFVGQPADAAFNLQVQAQSSDGSQSSVSLVVAAITATPIFPQSLGGSLQFTNPFNLVNGLMLGLL